MVLVFVFYLTDSRPGLPGLSGLTSVIHCINSSTTRIFPYKLSLVPKAQFL